MDVFIQIVIEWIRTLLVDLSGRFAEEFVRKRVRRRRRGVKRARKRKGRTYAR